MFFVGAFSSYYWARDKSRDLPMFPVYQSLGRSLRFPASYQLSKIHFLKNFFSIF